MPQYGVLVYAPAPADPVALSPEDVEALEQYPAAAKEEGGKVLGASYFPSYRGFAFEPVTRATSVRGETVSSGPMVESDLVPAAFFVLSAPTMDVAVRAAQRHPGAKMGGVEVRPLYAPPSEGS